MKLEQILTVNGETAGVIDCDIRLALNRPGRARFSVRSKKTLSGIVNYGTGYSSSKIYRYFLGYVVHSITVSDNEKVIFCRELTSALNRNLHLGLRYVSARDVLASISKFTGLSFAVAKSDYMQKQTPHFYHLGGGYQLMDSIGAVYQIPDYFWQLNGDGSVYVGSWQDSRWAGKAITLPDKLLTGHKAYNSARLGMIPSIRPGVKFNRGYITDVNLVNQEMMIQWSGSLNE